MSDAPMIPPVLESCWNQIGVWGDGRCPELRRVSHCRNCDVYATCGRRLLDRPPTEDYLQSWAATLAEEKVANRVVTWSHLVFRIGQAWLALPAANLREVAEPGTIRTVPHRPREVLCGLVNVRGELYPCVSLHALFGEEAIPPSRTSRLLVAQGAGGDWVFPVDEVAGIHDVAEQDIQPLPGTLSKADVVYTLGLFAYGGQTAAIIDEGLLFSALVRRIA